MTSNKTKEIEPEYITIDPKKFGYEEAITDKDNPIFKVYEEQMPENATLVAVLQGKNGVATLQRREY